MPFPLIPLIGAGAELAGNLISNIGQRKYNEKMYERQRRDALADREFENQYNSPAAQMKRLKEGGLNPNLVYGNGATAQGTTTRNTNAQGYSPKSPTEGMGNNLMMYYDTQLKQAQTDNVKAAVEIAKQELVNKMQEYESKGVTIDTQKFDLGVKQKLEPVTLEGAATKVFRDKANIQYTLDQNQRSALSNAQSLQKGVIEMLNMEAQRANTEAQRQQIHQQIKLLKKDEILKDLDINLRKIGVSTQDPAWMRAAAQIIAQPEQAAKKAKEIMDRVAPDITRPLFAKPGGWHNK